MSIPTDDAGYLASLIATRNNVAAELQQETLYIAQSGGARASYSLGPRHVQWNEWRAAMMKQLQDLNEMILALDQSYEIHVQGW